MSVNLDNLLKAMHNSIIEAQKLTEQQHIRMLNRYFYLDESNEETTKENFGKPKTLPIKLPHVGEDGKINYSEFEIPVISITPPTSMKIKNMKISFDAQISGFEEIEPKKKGFNFANIIKKKEQSNEQKLSENHQGPLMVDFKNTRNSPKNSTMAKIKIEFENGDAPEAVARINDQIIRTFPF